MKNVHYSESTFKILRFFFCSGVVSIDVVLSDININQCDDQETSEQDDKENLIEFLGTHLCKPSTKASTCPK